MPGSHGLRLVLTTGAAALVVAAVPTAQGVNASAADRQAPADRNGVDTPEVPTLDWTDCFEQFSCASAEVPLDYDRPEGRTIDVGLIRMAAADPEHKIGTLFVGAPGSASGVDLIRDGGPVLYAEELRARFDIVGFDRRSVSRTMPVRCFATEAEMSEFYGAVDPYPADRAELAELSDQSRTHAAACRERAGDLLAHASSADVARDLDLLRQAVGDDRLNYIGYSHSAYVGLIYANLFPNNIRSLVLDGPQYAPALTSGPRVTAAFSRSNADLGAEVALREFFDQCEAAGPAVCPFATGGDTAAKYDELSRRLRESPLGPELGWPDNFGDDELAAQTSYMLFSAPTYTDLGEQLQYLYGKTGPAARARAVEPPTQEEYPNGFDASYAIFCSDVDRPDTVRSLEAGARLRDRVSPHFGRFYAYYLSLCTDYPGPAADRYTGPWRTETSAPALVLGNTYDPITFLPGVRATSALLLPGSRMLTLRAWGHTSLGESQCANVAIADYVVHGVLPDRGTVCEADVPPFG
jgi:pimeloyl-ACP methyl ester carboxylesterase